MSAFFESLLAAAVISQLSSATIEGKVVDDHGNRVGSAPIVFFAPRDREGTAHAVELSSKTDGTGQFRVTRPPLRRDHIARANIWVYHPGSALAAAPAYQSAPTIALSKSEPRTIKIEAPDGQPIAAARVAPRVVLLASRNIPDDVPDSLAESQTVTTGSDGTATLNYLTPGDRLVAARVTAESIGTQDFQLVKRPGRDGQGATITLRLMPTSRLSGRLRNRAGQPIANQTVEVWSGGAPNLATNPVGFKNGPLRTAADGSFQTPDNLLAGSSYRVVVRADGMEPILSDWITIGEKPRVLLPMILRPLRTISGRVVDRQAKPLVGIEIFQSGDGPERTAIRSGENGRFTLGGFRQGPVFLFARGEGFRFSGRLIKPGEGDVTVELVRKSEPPTRAMPMRPDVVSLEESRALAQQLIEPYWEGFEKKKASDKATALRVLARVDPVGVLRKLEDMGLANPGERAVIQLWAARALALIDPTRAEAAAEAIDFPDVRCIALLDVADALPETPADRKLALLDRVLARSKLVPGREARLSRMVAVARRWYELGENEKAKKLLSEALPDANLVPKYSSARAAFTVQLARFDLKTALGIAHQFPDIGNWTGNALLRHIAFHLARDNPAEAERVLEQVPAGFKREWIVPIIVWRMAAADPARAQRLTDESQRSCNHPQAYLFLAAGLKTRDPEAARQAFQTAMQGIDRLMADDSLLLEPEEVLLPLVEQIDPALVPEYFWRLVAMRPSIGNPRSVDEFSAALRTALLAWYDREVAAALFEPVRAWMEHTDNLDRAFMGFEAWSVFDPRAAVARLERMPTTPTFELGADGARVWVAEMLGLPHDVRWQRLWRSYTEMSSVIDREIR
jgi:hypothetical protein